MVILPPTTEGVPSIVGEGIFVVAGGGGPTTSGGFVRFGELGRFDCVWPELVAFSGPGDGDKGGFSLCGDSGNWLESSSIDDILPCAWL